MESLQDIQARHRKEAKALTGKITALKKSVGKGAGDKSKKKQIQEEIDKMEKELADRHAKEVEEASQSQNSTSNEDHGSQNPDENVNGKIFECLHEATESLSISDPIIPASSPDAGPGGSGGKKKKNRQKARMERREAELEALREAAAKEAAQAPNLKEVETNAIKELIQPLKLAIKEVMADGHCLYNALADQIRLTDSSSKTYTYKELRNIAADYMASHRDDFLPFLLTDEGDLYTPEQYQEYCENLRNQAIWGGQLEIQAISKALKKPVHIIQMGSPILIIGEEYTDKPLIVSYHKHAYGLGEHYNSLVPL